jgi:hypothetical protein
MIAWYNKLWLIKLLQKFLRGQKLPSPGTLGKIAADNDQRRGNEIQIGLQAFGYAWFLCSEMQIGNMCNGPHGFCNRFLASFPWAGPPAVRR